MTLLITLVLVLLLLGALPSWPHMAAYGYTPVILITIVIIIFLLSGGKT